MDQYSQEDIAQYSLSAEEVKKRVHVLLQLKNEMTKDPSAVKVSCADQLTQLFTRNSWNRIIFSVHGIVYDVTSYLFSHPGGPEILLQASGTDATNYFDRLNHSRRARVAMKSYMIGEIRSTKEKNMME